MEPQTATTIVVLSPLSRASSLGIPLPPPSLGIPLPPPPPPLLQIHRDITRGSKPRRDITTMTLSGVYRFILEGRRSWLFSLTALFRAFRLLMRAVHSRADLLTLGLAVTTILSSLVWLSIQPKSIYVVSPEGVKCQRICPHLPDSVVS